MCMRHIDVADTAYLSIGQASAMLGMSTACLEPFARSGALEVSDVGGHRAVSGAALKDFAARRELARQYVTGVINGRAERTARYVARHAPISDEALRELDTL